jgi:hypothetical protein
MVRIALLMPAGTGTVGIEGDQYMKSRAGPSKIEVALCLLIVSVLAGLIIPAIVRVREAAALSKRL